MCATFAASIEIKHLMPAISCSIFLVNYTIFFSILQRRRSQCQRFKVQRWQTHTLPLTTSHLHHKQQEEGEGEEGEEKELSTHLLYHNLTPSTLVGLLVESKLL